MTIPIGVPSLTPGNLVRISASSKTLLLVLLSAPAAHQQGINHSRNKRPFLFMVFYGTVHQCHCFCGFFLPLQGEAHKLGDTQALPVAQGGEQSILKHSHLSYLPIFQGALQKLGTCFYSCTKLTALFLRTMCSHLFSCSHFRAKQATDKVLTKKSH